uniref:Retrovirus-related Pol polyprotein from transposon TNT 1-94 n=1 Tax=Rhizophora mucronata TaxID=61149 RepID=A0A2P2JV27_RHIMU
MCILYLIYKDPLL